MTNKQIELYIKRFSQFQSDRGTWEAHWSQIADIINPFNNIFNTEESPGASKMDFVFDSTCIHANQLLAAGLFSLMTNPAQLWHSYKAFDDELNDIFEVREWTDAITKISFHEINKTEAKFNSAIHEGYIEYGAFGAMIIYTGEDTERKSLSFQSLPLAHCYLQENEFGFVDTLFRKYNRTVRQLVQRFGLEALHEEVQKKYNEQKYEDKIECVHIIEPVMEISKLGFTYTSIYLDIQFKHIIQEKGYYEQPFAAARFYKSAHEIYGRGPGSIALPDGKMLQEAMRTTIRSAQKAVDPPLQAPNEGFLNPIRTMPGGVNYYASGSGDRIEPIKTGVNPGIGMDIISDLRTRIREIFFVDQLQLQEGPQMTATEVIQRTEEKLRLMGPMMGRLQSELLGPMLNRVYAILSRNNKFPRPPEILDNKELRVIYTSPIAKAQEQTEANGLLRSLEVLSPFMQTTPEIMDNFNTDKLAQGVTDMFSVSAKFLNSEDDRKKMRAQRAKAQQAKDLSENLRNMGQGADSLARAADTVGPEQMAAISQGL